MENTKTEFSTGLLRERIRDNGLTLAEFAKKLGISEISLHRKLRGATAWTQDEMFRATEILGVNDAKIAWELFFRPKNLEN